MCSSTSKASTYTGRTVSSTVVREFMVARNPEEGSSLPYLVHLPIGPAGIVLKVRDLWPRTTKLYCHRADWPRRRPTSSNGSRCGRASVAGRRSTSCSTAAGRTGRSSCSPRPGARRHLLAERAHRQAGPAQRQPADHAGVGSGARDPRRQSRALRVEVRRPSRRRRLAGRLPAGDYAVEVGRCDRRRGRTQEPRRSRRHADHRQAPLPARRPGGGAARRDRRRGPLLLGVQARAGATGGRRPGIAEAQARFPNVPIVFAETRALAQEWTYRFLGAALVEHRDDQLVRDRTL